MTGPARHRRSQTQVLELVHRGGTALFALALWVFGILGFVNQLAFFATRGGQVLGLSSNGALATISLVVGAVLFAAALRGGRAASTTTMVVGSLFIVSGLANLAVLRTEYNLLAFELSNVFFSLIAGLALLFLGSYGRLSGGLPADNPYSRRHDRHDPHPPGPGQPRAQTQTQRGLDTQLARAERDAAQGAASADEVQRLQAVDRNRSHEQRRRAWAAFPANGADAPDTNGDGRTRGE